ncbi:hypothetical protein Asi03nite_04540 [Actinoplanes siamensis]|uniref:Uncharacterized protein n=1 Tax=Actinoplanes siamensis TaxID=1223317 RepID=A0A919K8G1_9ACTN|nr:hypothetical protein Asi03nite_04540 [Actinoplanes siamensis]
MVGEPQKPRLSAPHTQREPLDERNKEGPGAGGAPRICSSRADAGEHGGHPIERVPAPLPRRRHLEANVGGAGNPTPGQRFRACCNDPFKNHLHRRRGRR